MSTTTVRPSTTVSNTGAVTGAGGDADAALADDSVASYITLDGGEEVEVAFANPTIPAGAVLRDSSIRATTRLDSSGGPANAVVELNQGSALISDTRLLISWTVATITTPFAAVSADDFDPDAAQLYMRMPGAARSVRLLELFLDAVYVEEPSTTVDAPTGTLTMTNRPTVEWTRDFDPDGGPGYQWIAKVFSQAQYEAGGFDPETSGAVVESGVVAGGGATWELPDGLPDGNYRAYVKWWQRVNDANHVADWAFSAFTVDVDQPAAPDLVLTAQSDEGRIRLDMADNAGAVSSDLYEVERSIDGGLTFEEVRTAEGNGRITVDGAGDAVVLDYEAPNGIEATYRVRALHDYGSSAYGVSDWTTAAETWESSSWWLKHPTDPGLNVELAYLSLHAIGGVSRPVRRAIHHPLGARYPIAISDTPGPKSGVLQVRLDTEVEQLALEALFAASVPVLIQRRPGEKWTDRWVSLGDSQSDPLFDRAWCEPTVEQLPWTEVGRPIGELEAWL